MYVFIGLQFVFWFGVDYGFFLSWFLFLLWFGLGFLYFRACNLASKQLDKPQNKHPTSS